METNKWMKLKRKFSTRVHIRSDHTPDFFPAAFPSDPTLPSTSVGPAGTAHLEMDLVIEGSRLGQLDIVRLHSLLAAGPDWGLVFQIAAYHRVSLLLYHAFKSYNSILSNRSLDLSDQSAKRLGQPASGTVIPAAATGIPAAVMSNLRSVAANTARYSLRLVAELVKVLNLFEDQGIKALPFKGPAVAYSLYGGLNLRAFGDLDILVQESDIPKAMSLLISCGYRAPDQLVDTAHRPFLQFTPFLESPQSQGVFNFLHPEGPVVELHWRFTPRHFPFALAEEALWNRLGEVALPGKITRNLSPEDMLLLLCVHGSKHCWSRLIWISDVAALVNSAPDLNWSAALQRAKYLRVERMVRVGLLLAKDVLEADVPVERAQAARQDRTAVCLARWTYNRLKKRPQEDLSEMEEYWFTLKLHEVAPDRLRYFLHLSITPTEEDWTYCPLARPFVFLYYLIRPFRLVQKFLYLRLADAG